MKLSISGKQNNTREICIDIPRVNAFFVPRFFYRIGFFPRTHISAHFCQSTIWMVPKNLLGINMPQPWKTNLAREVSLLNHVFFFARDLAGPYCPCWVAVSFLWPSFSSSSPSPVLLAKGRAIERNRLPRIIFFLILIF